MIQFNGQNTFKEIHYSSHDIKYVYGGCSGDLVWEKGTPPVPPVFDGKFKLTLNDSSVVTAACDSTSAVTRNEISSQYSGTVVSAEIGDCVISIGNVALHGCSGLTSCTIGSSVTSIGSNAFYRCSGLTNIDIPNSVTRIDVGAFGYCTGLTSCTLGNNVASINNNTFSGCKSLTGITIPNSVTSIGQQAFFNCTSLTDLTIPDSVTSIGIYAFWGCSGLTSITVNAVTPPSLENNVFNNTNNCPIYVPCESVNAYKAAWSAYANRIQCVPQPFGGKYKLTLQDSSVISAECDSSSAITNNFRGYNFADMVIGNCVTTIEPYALSYCRNATSITISNSVTSVGHEAFQNSDSLISLTIPSSVNEIGFWAFARMFACTEVIFENPDVFSVIDNEFNLTQVFHDWYPPVVYVPDESVAAYRAKGLNWWIDGINPPASIDDWIRPISERP